MSTNLQGLTEVDIGINEILEVIDDHELSGADVEVEDTIEFYQGIIDDLQMRLEPLRKGR